MKKLKDVEEFRQHLIETGEYACTCFIHPPCTFCTDTVSEMYEEYLEQEDE